MSWQEPTVTRVCCKIVVEVAGQRYLSLLTCSDHILHNMWVWQHELQIKEKQGHHETTKLGTVKYKGPGSGLKCFRVSGSEVVGLLFHVPGGGTLHQRTERAAKPAVLMFIKATMMRTKPTQSSVQLSWLLYSCSASCFANSSIHTRCGTSGGRR
eukprot:780871-Pelagomonas_calceolata.AAC.1